MLWARVSTGSAKSNRCTTAESPPDAISSGAGLAANGGRDERDEG